MESDSIEYIPIPGKNIFELNCKITFLLYCIVKKKNYRDNKIIIRTEDICNLEENSSTILLFKKKLSTFQKKQILIQN